MFRKNCRIFLISVIFIRILLVESSAKSKVCEPINCGSGPDIIRPFWIPEQQDSSCGSPGFEITCSGKNPVLTISNDDYVVRDIFYSNGSIHLANSQVLDENSSCPTPMHNFTTFGSPFNSTESFADLYFFYNCTIDYESERYSVGCASDDSQYSFAVFHEIFVEESNNFSVGSCQHVVNAPVSGDDLGILLRMNYTDILRKGFVLQWCNDCKINGKKQNNSLKVKIGLGAGVGSILCLMFTFVVYFYYQKLRTKNDERIEAFIAQYEFSTTKRFKFYEIKKMTNSFKVELGRGGFGTVFKGVLQDGSLVAVKVLKRSKANGEEFINEVSSIGKTSHVNIVSLLGFCYEAKERALVYEFMPNGSLDKFMNHHIPIENAQILGVERLYEIVVGIARGLEYLHRGCTTPILHFDIKPHNILLDKDFCPKISDFGLAKIHPREESIVSMNEEARGTIGYIAPEVFNRNFGGVSHKSDVYSYGMMVLEMVCGRKNINARDNHSSDIYFPQWIYMQLEQDEDLGTVIMENGTARKMTIVGLWCIQTNPSQRPSIRKVIEMLEGNIERLEIPPNTFYSSPPPLPVNSSTTRESSSLEEDYVYYKWIKLVLLPVVRKCKGS